MRYLSIATLCFTLGMAAFASEKPVAQGSDRSMYICTARSILGKRFSATGVDKVLTQEDAMQKCEAYAFRCYRTGCDVTGRR